MTRTETLKAAAVMGHLSVASLLVDHGADIHDYGDGVLWDAVHHGKREVVRYLVEQAGADVRGESWKKRDALIEAAM
ncbi:hypothetical protein HDU93_002898, partial [Gonapodya sp. JEL0774]